MTTNPKSTTKGDILLVDDNPESLLVLSVFLTEQGYQVREVTSGELALSACQTALPDVILLDLVRPEMDGYEVCYRLKAEELTRDIPVIFLSAKNQVSHKIQAFEVDGADYITKPFQLEEVLARIANQLRIAKLQKQLIAKNLELQKEIQERQQAEAELQAIFASMNELILVFDGEGRYIKIAPTDSPLLYKPAAELIGKTIAENFPPKEAEMFLQHITTALSQQQKIQCEYSLNIDSEERWFAANIAPLNQELVILVAQDITDRKLAEIAAQQEQEKFAQAFRFLPNAIAISRLTDNCLIEVNESFLEILGYQRSEVIGKNIQDLNILVNLEDSTYIAGLLLEGHRVRNFECNLRAKSGEIKTFLASVEMINFGGETCILSASNNITERQKAQQELKETKERYALAIQAANDGLWDWDFVKNEIYFSPRWKEMLGYADHELPNQLASWEKVIFREDWIAALKLIEAYNSGKINRFLIVQRFHHRNRSTVYVLSRAIHLQNESGEVIRMVGSHTDITELIQAQEALQQSEARHRALLNAIPDTIFRISASGTYLDVKESAGSFIYPTQTFIGKNLQDLTLPAEFKQQVGQWLEVAIAQARSKRFTTEELQTYECELAAETGNHNYELRLVKSGVEEVVCIVRDITERKRSELALRESEERFRVLVNSAPVGIFQTNAQGELLFVNPRWLEITGMSESEAIASQWMETVHPDDRQRVLAEWERTSTIGREFALEFRILAPEKEIVWVFTRAVAMRDRAIAELRQDAVTRYFATVTDISARKNAEAALQQQLQKSNLLRQISEEIRSSLDSRQIFATAVNQLGRRLGVSRCLIHTYIPEPTPQIPIVAEYLATGVTSLRNLTIPITDNHHLQELLRKDWAISSPDVYVEPLLTEATAICDEIDLKSMLAVRASYQGEPNGLIYVHQCDRFREWTVEEIELLESVAVQLGVAIAQARLLEQEKAQNLQLQQEIRERELAEAALQESQRFIQAIADANPNLLYLYDVIEQTNIYINRAATKVLGYAPQELHNHQIILALTHPDDIPKLQANPQKFAAVPDGEIVETEYRLRHKNGEWRWLLARDIIFKRNTQGEPQQILGTATDISDLKRAETALQAAAHAAEAANRAKSAFLANMSHELRTPLNAIIGFTQVLVRDASLTAEQQEFLGIINRSGEHLLALINDILSLSKIEAGRTTLNETNFDLYHLLATLEEMLQLKAQSQGLQLVFSIAPDLPQYIKTDESKLRQVLLNLLDNAIKFTPQGKVTLCANYRPPHKLSFAISDTGLGIAPAELRNLFEVFVQTETGKNSQEGTGLGLPIARQFVEMMGGTIAVHSTVGEGSIFTFDVQVNLAPAADVPELSIPQRVIGLAPHQPPYRILVVEDALESRQLLVKLLSSVGFEVQSAVNGQEAIALWSNWQPHLIWMDMRMPIMDGYAAVRQIRAKERELQVKVVEGHSLPANFHTPIIALTASAFEEDRTAVLAAGCNDFIRKPFQEKVIFEKMSRHLGIKYIYAEENQIVNLPKTADNLLAPETNLADQIAALPANLVGQLHQAALCADDGWIMDLIAQISPSNVSLSNFLADLVSNFRFDKIVDLTQPWSYATRTNGSP